MYNLENLSHSLRALDKKVEIIPFWFQNNLHRKDGNLTSNLLSKFGLLDEKDKLLS